MTALDPELAHVIALERALLDPAIRTAPAEVLRLLHPDFREVGASGRVWDREGIVAALAADPGEAARASDLTARFVADGVVLVTYRADGIRGPSLRSTLWRRGEDGWRALFHQGTPLTSPDAPT